MKQIPTEKCITCPDYGKGEKLRYCKRTFTVIKGKTIMCPKKDGK